MVGGLSYLVFIVGFCVIEPDYNIRSVILVMLVSVWAIRLTTFLFRRATQDGGDCRFDSIKQYFMPFLLAWTVQGFWSVVTVGAAASAISSELKPALTWWDTIGILLWFIGFAVEIIADWQKRRFKRNKNNSTPFIRIGLWRYCRHPNYMGEIILWVGVAWLALPSLVGWQLLSLMSPLFVILLLTKISGIPLLEEKADERWSDSVVYQQYKQHTSVLVPWPRTVNSAKYGGVK